MSATVRTARETVELLLRTAVEGTRDDIADLYAPNTVIEFGFAPPGGPATSQGRETLRQRMKATEHLWHFDSVNDITLHSTTDPEVVVAEYKIRGTISATEAPFTLTNICVIRVVDGLIVSSRDYSNPQESEALREMFATLEA